MKLAKARGLEPKAYLMSAIRKVWLMSAERNEALKAAKFGKTYLCAGCSKQFARKEINVDHREPIGSFVDWNTLIDRLFCPADKLRILCKACHREKTNAESRERSEQRAQQEKADNK